MGILTKRLAISDGRGDRRKFDTGPSRRPAKHVFSISGTRPDAFQKWKKRWERGIESGGEYFEGDRLG